MRIAFAAGILILTSVAGFAQTPYAGMQSRPIKALSEQQVADLQAGRGMGFALAAELNGYPGPSHVLELADKLGLSADQRENAQQLFNAMKQEALPIGAKLISQEAELDRQFAGRTVTPASLKSVTSAIAVTQGELRETHLKYHLSTLTLLTQNQRQKYSELRGYGGQDSGGHDSGGQDSGGHGAGQQHHHN
jgi:Spy/CpxP family protein refolding chaperone